MAVAARESALSRVVRDPVSRRKLLAVTGGSTALAALLAACGDEPSPVAFDPALSEAKVLKAVEPFIQ